MIRYELANVPRLRPGWLAQAPAASPAQDTKQIVLHWGVNMGILLTGVAIALVGSAHRKKPMGLVALQAGGSIAGAAFVLMVLDAFSAQNPNAAKA